MFYWRPKVAGRQAVVVGYSNRADDEGGEAIARCTLRGTLAQSPRSRSIAAGQRGSNAKARAGFSTKICRDSSSPSSRSSRGLKRAKT